MPDRRSMYAPPSPAACGPCSYKPAKLYLQELKSQQSIPAPNKFGKPCAHSIWLANRETWPQSLPTSEICPKFPITSGNKPPKPKRPSGREPNRRWKGTRIDEQQIYLNAEHSTVKSCLKPSATSPWSSTTMTKPSHTLPNAWDSL